MVNHNYAHFSLYADKTAATWVSLALLILNIVAVLYGCLVVARRPWLKQDGRRSRSKYLLYVFASITILLKLSILIVNTILEVMQQIVAYTYYVIFIFQNFGFRTSDILIVALFYGCIEDYCKIWLPTPNHEKIVQFHVCIVSILILLSTAGFIIYARCIVTLLQPGIELGTPYVGGLEITRTVLMLLIAGEIFTTSVILTIKRAIPKYLLLLTSSALIIYTIISILAILDITYTPDYFSIPFQWALTYIIIITNIIIFIGLAFLSRESNKSVHEKLLDRRISNFGSREGSGEIHGDYASPSPYASNPYENGNGIGSENGISGYQYDPVSRDVSGFSGGQQPQQQQRQQRPSEYVNTAPEVHYQSNQQPISPIRGTYYNGTGTGTGTGTTSGNGGYVPVSIHEVHY